MKVDIRHPLQYPSIKVVKTTEHDLNAQEIQVKKKRKKNLNPCRKEKKKP